MNMALDFEGNSSTTFALEKNNYIDFLLTQYNNQKANLLQTFESLKEVSPSNVQLFQTLNLNFPDQEQVLHLLNVQFWGQVYKRSNIEIFLDAEKREKWKYDLLLHPNNKAVLPEFTYENILSTITAWHSDRESLFADRVDHVFRSLSKTHITNEPQGFGKKMIFSYGCDECWYHDSAMTLTSTSREILFDLACVLATLLKLPTPAHFQQAMFSRLETGKKHDCYGGTFQIQVFKNRNVHVWIDPSLAIDLNIWLAKKYPTAIPTEFRSKPKTIKEFVYRYDFLTPEDIKLLTHLSDGRSLSANAALGYQFDKNAIERFVKFVGMDKEALYTLERNHGFIDVARMIMRSGYPNIKDHQYYPTPSSIVETIKDHLAGSVENEELKILEPSAGSGKLAEIFKNKENVHCVEVSPFFCRTLQGKGFSNISNQDFLKFEAKNSYDIIVMNPPYSKKQLESHLTKALTHLKEQGELYLVAPKGKLNAISEIANSRHVQVLCSHKGEFDDTSIETSVYLISA